MRYWLLKSEPECYSIHHLKQEGQTCWSGIRNFQARNFMIKDIKMNDLALFYHSNATPSGIAGICRVCKTAYPDFTAWDIEDEHFDPKASPKNPIWQMVDVAFESIFNQFIPLSTLHDTPELAGMMVLQKGSRLSVMPVEEMHFKKIVEMGNK